MNWILVAELFELRNKLTPLHLAWNDADQKKCGEQQLEVRQLVSTRCRNELSAYWMAVIEFTLEISSENGDSRK
jgi:hypothetical protein